MDLSYGVACCDCRDAGAVARLLDGRKVNLAITSPPYASQRAYDETSGFRPIRPEDYVAWYKDVAAVVEQILAPDGSYLLNIKEHADEGERSLYVKDLVLAHKRQWGWRFVDEFCWRKTSDGVPGGWGNRFKNAWEPVFHFCRQPEIKFRPHAVGHISQDCFDYSPDNPKSTSGSGLLGTGPRGAAADRGKNGEAWQRSRRNLSKSRTTAGQPSEGGGDWGHMRRKLMEGRFEGVARPSNVIETIAETTQGSHAAPFPRALVEFFIKAFTEPGDVVFDPFLGSGTTMASAFALGRSAFGCEISPAYCDVIVRRVENLSSQAFRLAGDGRTFGQVAETRGVAVAA